MPFPTKRTAAVLLVAAAIAACTNESERSTSTNSSPGGSQAAPLTGGIEVIFESAQDPPIGAIDAKPILEARLDRSGVEPRQVDVIGEAVRVRASSDLDEGRLLAITQPGGFRVRPVRYSLPGLQTGERIRSTEEPEYCESTTERRFDVPGVAVVYPGLADDDANGIPDECFHMGPAHDQPSGLPRLDESEVADAVPVRVGDGWAVSITIAANAVARYDHLVDTCITDQILCGDARIAFVLDGRVLYAPLATSLPAGGANIQIATGVTEDEANDMASVLVSQRLLAELKAREVRTFSSRVLGNPRPPVAGTSGGLLAEAPLTNPAQTLDDLIRSAEQSLDQIGIYDAVVTLFVAGEVRRAAIEIRNIAIDDRLRQAVADWLGVNATQVDVETLNG